MSHGSIATVSNLDAAVGTGLPIDNPVLSEYEAIDSSDGDMGHSGSNWTRDAIIGVLGLAVECIAVILEIKWKPMRRLVGAFRRWFSRVCRSKREGE